MRRYLIFLLPLIFCGSCRQSVNQSDKEAITISILPQKFLIEEIGGGNFSINVLVPDGSGPETYEPTARQLQEISRSKAYFMTGLLDFEKSWYPKVAENNPDLKIINLSEGTTVISGETHVHSESAHTDHNHDTDEHSEAEHNYDVHSGDDPHIWLSIQSLKVQSNVVLRELTELKPELKDVFEANHMHLTSRLDSIDNVIRGKFNAVGHSVAFMIYHPSLSYYSRDYDVNQIPIELEGKEPSPAYLKELIDKARELKIGIILYSEQFDKKSAETLSQQLDIPLYSFNPLSPDVEENLLSITDIIIKAQGNE